MNTFGQASNNNNNNSHGSHRIGVYDGKIAGLYDLEETLGSGHFAVVKLARHVFTGEKVAVKVIDKTKLDEVSRSHLFQEVRCMKLVQHPNVVRLYEVIDTQTKLYLILELGDGGDLYDYIMKHDGGLKEHLAQEYFRQIVRAISYCHQLHVVHRDLKPENVVFFEKLGLVKLTDFGFSNKFCPGQKLETSCGSLAYSAPEILLGDSYDAPAVDVWSLGVILYMLVCGHPPFQEANDSETLTMIMDCKYTIPAHISDECRDLISTMLVVAPDKRFTLHQIAQHPWLQMGPGQLHAHENVPEIYLPLVSREQVSEDDHTLIIQKMVNGSIATKDEILEALDKNEYNHITATYFLLAERKLRAHRQEHEQKHKPVLSIPETNLSRLSPKSRLQGLKELKELQTNKENNDFLQSSLKGQLTVPRAPGSETTQTGRIRKCSIVQEEEDDEDDAEAEEEVSLNRRGSRSEGRISITVADRIAENDRLKKEPTSAPSEQVDVSEQNKGLFHGLRGVTLVCSNSDPKEKLGIVRGSAHVARRPLVNVTTAGSVPRANSVDHAATLSDDSDVFTSTKFLTDSMTITIPIMGNQPYVPVSGPKYKTMPSPTRINTILPGANPCLNEIFEEATDIGSSDSATTTPRPIAKHAHCISHRTQSQAACSSGGVPSNAASSARRSKFHKTRTASCSSSDASDDDSENRKKRAHKIVDSSKPVQQRRDSYDDSSDSQDPGTGTSGSTTSSAYHLQMVVGSHPDDKNKTKENGDSGNSNTNSRQKSGQPMGFRRHRAGRRRAGETRLRESQSLNRITEVQESEPTALLSQQSKCTEISPSVTTVPSPKRTITVVQHKSRGFSARLFQGFRKSDSGSMSPSPSTLESVEQIKSTAPTEDGVEMVLGVELAKVLKASGDSKGNSATKKLKMLGRYFQVHKKLCIPLPGIFQRGRLYKAQSCSSIMRDKITPPSTIVGQPTTNTGRHSTLFSEKTRVLRNCLGSRHLGSDGDINQNGDLTKGNTKHVSDIYTVDGTDDSRQAYTTIPKTTSTSTSKTFHPFHQPRHGLSDASLCSSKC